MDVSKNKYLANFEWLFNNKIRNGLYIFRLLAKLQNKDIVHFFHIGKTGGSSVKYALKLKNAPLINNEYIIFGHSHTFTLKDTYPGEKIFFFVRDPIDRFISGFYSRKRKGAPRIYVEWSPEEKQAFETFDTPNELAVSLSSVNEDLREKAIKAMNSIGHVRTSLWNWFINDDNFNRRLNDIIFVGTQKNLNKDFERLKKLLYLSDEYILPKDNIKAHKNPDDVDKDLSDKAYKNLKDWYSEDYRFLNLLHDKGLL